MLRTLAWRRAGLDHACQSGNMAILLTLLLFVCEISFLPKYRVNCYDNNYYKVVLWDIMQLVCIAVYCPHFSFNVYMDDLSIALSRLSACCTGCCVSNTIMNHSMYADDLVIFSPSSVGLRAILSVCEQYGTSHESMTYDLIIRKVLLIMICRGKYEKCVSSFVHPKWWGNQGSWQCEIPSHMSSVMTAKLTRTLCVNANNYMPVAMSY